MGPSAVTFTGTVVLLSGLTLFAQQGNRVTLNFNRDWKFTKSSPSGAERPDFNDAGWEDVGIPHTFNDWDIFNGQGKCGDQSAFWKGIVWYRKHFTLDQSYRGRCVYVEFEGVAVNGQVWVNGTELGRHRGSAVPFVFRIDQLLDFGATENVIAVKVDNQDVGNIPGPGGMYWLGTDQLGGIVRDVRLHVMDKVHIPINVYSYQNTWGTYVAATRVDIPGSAEITMLTRVKNAGDGACGCVLTSSIVDSAGAVVASAEDEESISGQSEHEFSQTATIANPRLWGPVRPYLYRVVSTVWADGNVVDVCETPLGVRTFSFEGDDGFFLNGSYLKLHGSGWRQGAYGGLGNAVSNYLHDHDVRLLADAGGNFIRLGHSAVDPAVMDGGDRYGVMIIDASMADESDCTGEKLALKLEFMRDIVVRDRNHPCVILWELNNGPYNDASARQTVDVIKQWDPLVTRPTTCAGNNVTYQPRGIEDVIGTHQAGGYSWKAGYPSKSLVMLEWGWGAFNAFRADGWGPMTGYARTMLDKVYQADGFEGNTYWAGYTTWTWVESAGECQPSPYGSKGVCARFALLDANGRLEKEPYHAFRCVWARKPEIHISGHWTNWGESNVTVFVSPHIKSVGLFVNNQGVDEAGVDPKNAYVVFTGVSYSPGTLRAEGRDGNGTTVAVDSVSTAGAPATIVLTAFPETIAADRSEAAIVVATVTDENGRWHPTASNDITFSVSGPGNYRGGFNHLRDNTTGQSTLAAELGKIAVAVRSTNETGSITVSASSNGLQSGSVTVQSVDPQEFVEGLVRRPAAAIAGVGGKPHIGLVGNSLVVAMPGQQRVSLSVVNAAGQTIARLADGVLRAGVYRFPLHAPARTMGSSVVFAVLRTSHETLVRRVAVVR